MNPNQIPMSKSPFEQLQRPPRKKVGDETTFAPRKTSDMYKRIHVRIFATAHNWDSR